MSPREMNNINRAMLVDKLQNALYDALYLSVYGKQTDANKIVNNVADVIAVYEKSAELNPFSSKFDSYTKEKVNSTSQKFRGLAFFKN